MSQRLIFAKTYSVMHACYDIIIVSLRQLFDLILFGPYELKSNFADKWAYLCSQILRLFEFISVLR